MAEDKKMNQFTSATDAIYMYAEAADGSQVKIEKTTLVKLIRNVLHKRFNAGNGQAVKFSFDDGDFGLFYITVAEELDRQYFLRTNDNVSFVLGDTWFKKNISISYSSGGFEFVQTGWNNALFDVYKCL